MTMNRRTFLGTTAATTVALGTPMILRAQPAEYVLEKAFVGEGV